MEVTKVLQKIHFLWEHNRLKVLNLFSLSKRRLRGSLIMIYKIMTYKYYYDIFRYIMDRKIPKGSFVQQRKDLARISVGSERQTNLHWK